MLIMKLITLTILLLLPTVAYADIELIFMLQDIGVFTESEVFNLIFNEMLWLK